MGPLSDSLGRRPVLLASLVVFMIGSICCALSPTIEILIASRLLQAPGHDLQITLGLVVGTVAQKFSLAGGFAIIGSVYVFAFISAVWPVNAESTVISDTVG